MEETQYDRDVNGTGDPITDFAAIDWADITASLANLLRAVRRDMELPGSQAGLTEQSAGFGSAVNSANVRTQALLALISPVASSAAGGEADHPLARLARAYAEAFEAVRYAITSMEPQPRGQGRLPQQLAELAERAASALVQAVDLVFGQKRLGSLANVFAYVGAVEGQADDLLRRGIDALLSAGSDPAAGGWDPRRADELRTLLALEALTDRCEDVADALLLVRYVL